MELSESADRVPERGSGGEAPSEKMLRQHATEMVIFTRTFDFLAWLLPHTNHFPRAHRHSLRRWPAR